MQSDGKFVGNFSHLSCLHTKSRDALACRNKLSFDPTAADAEASDLLAPFARLVIRILAILTLVLFA